MILVNTTVFFGDSVFSSLSSLNPNQSAVETENIGINYKYMECFQQFQSYVLLLVVPFWAAPSTLNLCFWTTI